MLQDLAETLRTSRGFAHKRDIADVVGVLARSLPQGMAGLAAAVPVGDDCAAIPDGQGGHLLFAIEGFINEFVATEPWFAGWCGVMVNLSDVAAMGGRPLAVVDALWSAGPERAKPLLEGMAAACAAYGVPLLGGHSNTRCDREQLAVAVLGRAQRLLTSFDAEPGDALLMAIDLRGRYHEPNPFFDAATSAPLERLRAAMGVLPAIAEAGLAKAAKDISMAGAIGSALMLLECSSRGGLRGAVIDVSAVPRPPGVDLARWLLSFPSYGYVLSVPPARVPDVKHLFAEQGIACAAVGTVDDTGLLQLVDTLGEAGLQTPEPVVLWDLRREALTGCGGGAQP